MSIEIKFENVITKNGKGYRIISFSLLDAMDLPDAYVYGSLNGTVAYATGGSIFVRHENNNGGGAGMICPLVSYQLARCGWKQGNW